MVAATGVWLLVLIGVRHVSGKHGWCHVGYGSVVYRVGTAVTKGCADDTIIAVTHQPTTTTTTTT